MKKIVLMFPGQGSQHVGMVKNILNDYSQAKDIFEQANDATGLDIQSMCLSQDEKYLSDTIVSQLTVFTVNYIYFKKYMKEIGIKPRYLLGHSLGEISALVAAGALEFYKGIQLVKKRSEWMKQSLEANPGRMTTVIGVPIKDVEKIVSEINLNHHYVTISNYNGPDDCVISGTDAAVKLVEEEIVKLEGKIIQLKVSGAFHSKLMSTAATNMKSYADTINFNNCIVPIISGKDAENYSDRLKIGQTLSEQIVSPVNWMEAVESLTTKYDFQFIELGPKSTLKRMVKNMNRENEVYSYSNFADLEILLEQHTVQNKKVFSPTITSRAIVAAVSTKNNNWDEQEYNDGVLIPYEKLKRINQVLLESHRYPMEEEIKSTIQLLKRIFETKKIPAEEQKIWWNDIFDNSGNDYLKSDFKLLDY